MANPPKNMDARLWRELQNYIDLPIIQSKLPDEEVFPTSVEPLRVQGTFRRRKNRHSSLRLDEELLDTEALSIELQFLAQGYKGDKKPICVSRNDILYQGLEITRALHTCNLENEDSKCTNICWHSDRMKPEWSGAIKPLELRSSIAEYEASDFSKNARTPIDRMPEQFPSLMLPGEEDFIQKNSVKLTTVDANPDRVLQRLCSCLQLRTQGLKL